MSVSETEVAEVQGEPMQPIFLPENSASVLIQDIGKVKRNRGPGIKWTDIETENREEILYDTFEDVLAQVDSLNVSKLGEKSKKVFIYKCKFKNCPYRIKFMKRYDFKYDSSYTGEHSHDDNADAADGNNSHMRGLDDLQKKIVREGFNLGIMSINQILKYFRIQRAKREATEKFPVDPDRRKLTNYVASLKKKAIPEDVADGNDTSTKKKRGPGRPKRVEGGSGPEHSLVTKSDGEYWALENAAGGINAVKDEACDSDTEDEEEEGGNKGTEGLLEPLPLHMDVVCEQSKLPSESSSSSSSSSSYSAICISDTAQSSLLGKRRA